MESVYLWKAITLEGTSGHGIATGYAKKSVWKLLNQQGYYQISLDTVLRDQLRIALKTGDLIYILDSFTSILDAGISIVEALEMMVDDRRSIIVRYVFLKLKSDLHQGKSLEEGFSELSPLFSNFFIAMIRLCEKSGKLSQGLHDLQAFYQHQENRYQELVRIFRYPKIIFSMIILMSLGVIVFVVPMFSNVYALFKDELPILTQMMVNLSGFFHQNSLMIIAVFMGIAVWGYLPVIRFFHPWILLSQQLQRVLQSKEDPFLYAHAMSLLLESGQSVNQATKQATECMSEKNRKHGHLLTQRLNSGLAFSEAFQSSRWFPRSFQRFIVPAEKTGLLKLGFEQIYTYIDRKREAQFEKWSRFIEPLLMLILGAVTLTLLLSIYLPIFDLGNRIG
ncbi:MAG: type II secretion system F family protein [Deltaproteobacteria bacterium]|jgi:type IV pilus assembly protein PilC|nr:type II secretion system F family protein [Deltaproteobacteria bacterium]MBT4090189.1 type II secretion system F family protein [Deltaproteobacteria bacterium]MBT4264870.1 type II secretion system F family protein [Deltaproteobacteria bacterium]MBT4640044.1 type II secretion system F family protein [Deltaproteobacteria bacterium]MBT6610509.1 type II secretion system F family protein [Deltaproteobacteria bacterium]